MNRKIEVLAPAGSYESMRAAFNAGADAVYIGGRQFGARAYADNTTDDELLSAIYYAHLHGKQLYLTVNTLIKDREMEELYRWMKPLYEAGLDAAIVQDMGVFKLFRAEFPDLDIHASTQMTVTGPDGARLLKELGAVRVVPARELTVAELKEIYDATGMEVEAFIHGALCYGYSGQCLLSSLIGGRSGNRGRCAQACRLPFTAWKENTVINRKDEPYLISLKDLCGLDMLPAMLDAGVYSLKIEGRMKSPQYTAGVSSIYRKYVDRYLEVGTEGYFVDDADRHILKDLFDRGGTTDGYLRGKTGRQMLTLKEKPDRKMVNEALFRQIEADYLGEAKPIPVSGTAVLITGSPACLTITKEDGTTATVEGAVVEPALKQPISKDTVEKQLKKTGGSGYQWTDLDIITDDSGFLPVQELNRLRRDGFQQMTDELLSGFRRSVKGIDHRKKIVISDDPSSERAESIDGKTEYVPQIMIYLEDPKLLRPLLEQGLAEGYYLALETFGRKPDMLTQSVKQIRDFGKNVYLSVPAVFQQNARNYMLSLEKQIKALSPDGLLVRTLDSLSFCKTYFPDMKLIAESSVYTYNQPAKAMVRSLGVSRQVLPVELNFRELECLSTDSDELIAYGRLPVMYSANCIRKTTTGCSKTPEIIWLKDRKNKRFPVKNHCSVCFNTIYNSSPLCLLDCYEDVQRLKPGYLRLMFTTETEAEAKTMVQAYHDVFIRRRTTSVEPEDFTRGHYRLGIE